MAFQKAVRRSAKARILVEGPSGSGKSYGALQLAKGFGGKIAAIDTEHGSLSMYDNLVDFDVMELTAPFSPESYVNAIKEAEEAGYDVLIIDSLTHEWNGEGGCLDILEKIPLASVGGNSWAKWAKVTPRHNKFIEAILQSSCHIIATTRSKTEYVMETENGKNTPKKAGTAPQQRDGIDYEFTMVFSVVADTHVAMVTKDRTAQFAGFMDVITAKTGKKIVQWLDGGADAPAPEPVAIVEEHTAEETKAIRNDCRQLAKELKLDATGFLAHIVKIGGDESNLNTFTFSQAAALRDRLLDMKPAVTVDVREDEGVTV
jgi:hypothetical protein